jgi:undecaprenyl-diphosphatase
MEIQILNAIQLLRCSFLDVLMPLISNGLVLWFVLLAVLLIRRKTRRTGWIILTAIVLDVILCNIVMKNVFQRVRPCDVNTAVTLLVNRPTDYSFPSGHTALSFAVVTGLWLSGDLKQWRIPALIFAFLIAFSRLYLYVHYPTDILAGIAVGVFCGWAAYKIVQAIASRRQIQEVAV